MIYNINLVKPWAIDRGLDKSTTMAQFCKGVEEGGEIFEAILLRDKEKFVDAIGDKLVVLTIICMIEGLEPEDYIKQLSSNYEGESFLNGCLSRDGMITAMSFGAYQGELARAICKDLPKGKHIENLVYNLNLLCNVCCVDIRECYRIAYKEISNRTGKTVDGIYVKDE